MDLTDLTRGLGSRSEQARRDALVRIWGMAQVPDPLKPILVKVFSDGKFDEQLYVIIACNPCEEFSGPYMDMLTRPNVEWQAYALKSLDRWIELGPPSFKEALKKAVMDLIASSNAWIRFLSARALASFLAGGDKAWDLAVDAVIAADLASPAGGIRSEIFDTLEVDEIGHLNRHLKARGEEEID